MRAIGVRSRTIQQICGALALLAVALLFGRAMAEDEDQTSSDLQPPSDVQPASDEGTLPEVQLVPATGVPEKDAKPEAEIPPSPPDRPASPDPRAPAELAPVVADGPLKPPADMPLPRVPIDDEPGAIQRTGMFADIELPNPPGALRPSESQPMPAILPPQAKPVVTRAMQPADYGDGPDAPTPPSPEGIHAGGPAQLRVTRNSAAVAASAPVIAERGAFATTFDDPPPHPRSSLDPTGFNGVQPGSTTADDLVKLWGQGKESTREKDEVVYSYAATPFPRVDVTVAQDMVRSIVLHLERPKPPEELARQFKLTAAHPVSVPDESGEMLGQSFPERGVLFVYAPGGKHVSHVVLDRIDVDTFVLRADMDMDMRTRSALADLNYVLSQEPDHARALWMRARLLIGQARYEESLKAVDAALASDADEPIFRLTRAEILGRMGQFEQAMEQTKSVAESTGARHVQAKAMCQMGDLLAANPEHDYKAALDYHMSALKTAESLVDDKRPAIRTAAKLVQLDANLGLANDIAAGYWKHKDRIVPEWLDRAKTVAEDLVHNEHGDPALRLRMAREALRACAAGEGKIDPVPWTRMALQHGNKLVGDALDPWRKQRLEWELGAALSEGLAADDARGASQHSLANSTLTATHLETGARGRANNPDDAFRLGRMYYRIGSLHAVRRNDHKTAVAWYEKALPLLDRPLPLAQRAGQGRYGEWLVSMGISFWEVGRQDEALELTDAGVQHVQEAVAKKLVDEKALAIPYNNLASMNAALGRKNEAKNFSELASRVEGTVRR